MNRFLYEKIARPLLFQLSPETAHHVAMVGLDLLARSPGFCRKLRPTPDPKEARELFGVRFPNPVGLAAGFDKDASVLPAWEALGFGFIEAGTVTAKPQPGNEKPRLFRLPQQKALINRMGFNNDGAQAVAERLRALKAAGRWPSVPVGINIGKSKVTPLEQASEDYLQSFQLLREFADYVVLNVSSPNTPGLRKLQDREALSELLATIQAANTGLAMPVLLKMAPDLEWEQVEEVLNLAQTHQLAGLIATNTTINHSSVPEKLRTQGGLSGAPLEARSTEFISFLRARCTLPLIASGGIMSAEAAKRKLDAGADLVQLYTGFIYSGPSLIREIREICHGVRE